MAKTEFAEFIIARRAQVTPREVGLPEGRRRRTPGLRREEVATLAGVSVDYLARLEQGRDTNPSMAVVGALADALRLSEAEKAHLGKLAMKSSSGTTCPVSGEAREQLSPTVEAILDSLHPTPAFVIGRRLNVLGWNAAWADFAEPLGLFDDVAHSNLAIYTFAHPKAAGVWRNWPEAADVIVAQLRWSQSRWHDDTDLLAMIDRLQALPEFARRWEAYQVQERRSGVLRTEHPDRGSVDVDFEFLETAPDQSIVVWLTERRPALRLVQRRAVNE